MGRPLKFETVEDLQTQIDAYFAECDPHWIDEEYWEYPEKETNDELEAQGHGGALKRKRKDLDFEAEPILKTRKVLTRQTPYTITGLAMALDTSRETLLDYQSGKHDGKDETQEDTEEDAKFSDAVKRAKVKIENYNEIALYGQNVAGPIFNLKNNYGWRDKTEQDLHVKELPKPLLGGNSVPADHSN